MRGQSNTTMWETQPARAHANCVRLLVDQLGLSNIPKLCYLPVVVSIISQNCPMVVLHNFFITPCIFKMMSKVFTFVLKERRLSTQAAPDNNKLEKLDSPPTSHSHTHTNPRHGTPQTRQGTTRTGGYNSIAGGPGPSGIVVFQVFYRLLGPMGPRRHTPNRMFWGVPQKTTI